jgi:hypothetical protein
MLNRAHFLSAHWTKAVVGASLTTAASFLSGLGVFKLGYWPGMFSDGGVSKWVVAGLLGWPCLLPVAEKTHRRLCLLTTGFVLVAMAVYYVLLGVVMTRGFPPVLLHIVPVFLTTYFVVPAVWRRIGSALSEESPSGGGS